MSARLAMLLLASYTLCAESLSFSTFDVPGAQSTFLYGINDAGDLVGRYSTSPSPLAFHAFLVHNGNLQTIDLPGSIATSYFAISNSGLIAGSYLPAQGSTVEFISQDGVLQPVHITNLIHRISGVNSSGDLVGSWPLGGFLFSGGVVTQIRVPDEFTAGADAINDAGQIVGAFVDDTAEHGYVYLNGVYTAIDYPGAVDTDLEAINSLGDMAGRATDGMQSAWWGFLLSGGTFTRFDLPAFASIQGLNSSDVVIGNYSDANGTHGFILSEVPEPGSLWLVISVAALVGMRRRR